jgi:hypothetical protein
MTQTRHTITLSETHWNALANQACLHAWVEARQMDLTVAECDRIALAALRGVRTLTEQWARQQEEQARGVQG